jgi:hypothetical protein
MDLYMLEFPTITERKTMQYLIIREIQYERLDNSYDVMNQTTDINKANDMVQGYNLINKDEDTTYSIVKYESPLVLTKEVA